MESCSCPITQEVFEDPVMGDDGHTYERKAIVDWLTKNGTSPLTRQPMDINSLRTNYMVKKIIEDLKSMPKSLHNQYQFELNVEIRKTKQRPLFQAFGKTIYEAEWINHNGPSIILLKIDGAKANREASFYVQLSCHPHIVRTFGLVQGGSGSVTLLQECASQGDLSELLRENGFKPTERVLYKIFEQICDAMICLAYNNIVHGDLACRNVLVFQSNATEPEKNLVKLTDFGLTRASSLFSTIDTPTKTIMNTIPTRYVAPEILRSINESNYTEKSDVYSMGVLMWEACSYGELPYSSIDNDDEVRRKKLMNERLSRPSLCGDHLWNLMNECWHQEPENRISFQKLKQQLSRFDFDSHHNNDNRLIRNENNDTNIQYNSDNSKRTPVNEKGPKLPQLAEHKSRSVLCKLCKEEFPSSSTLREHLLLCENKMEQCPICRRFIPRAIFIFHTKSNCTNSDETNATLINTGNILENPPIRESSEETSSKERTNTDQQENCSSRTGTNRSMTTNNSSRAPISEQQKPNNVTSLPIENMEFNREPSFRQEQPNFSMPLPKQNVELNCDPIFQQQFPNYPTLLPEQSIEFDVGVLFPQQFPNHFMPMPEQNMNFNPGPTFQQQMSDYSAPLPRRNIGFNQEPYYPTSLQDERWSGLENPNLYRK